ncbi:hypothetical protein GCM10009858_32810 [Terrabacter carboxydivorans]|uniref:Uncharacterized protein n=1 Tax=Terrabacter carboxydivorans TaxID=619730 RepID=A0ABN3LXS8_9MICO
MREVATWDAAAEAGGTQQSWQAFRRVASAGPAGAGLGGTCGDVLVTKDTGGDRIVASGRSAPRLATTTGTTGAPGRSATGPQALRQPRRTRRTTSHTTRATAAPLTTQSSTDEYWSTSS